MLKIKKIFSKILLVVGAIGCLFTPVAGEESPTDSTELKRMLDSMGTTIEGIESKVRSTLMFGGSSPVSFSGEARLKLQFHQMDNPPPYLRLDKSYLTSNWEGNESFVRLGMVARAGRNAVLWSKIGFQHTLPGNYLKRSETTSKIPDDVTTDEGLRRAASRHDKGNIDAIIHEDMNAGIAIRTVPASFWLKMGAVQWIEASPLTIWKSQPRTFAWEYLPFEVEQPISRYYEYNIAKGEKSGRAAWNKKAFQGISFESINLPADLYFNFFYGTYERYDNFESEYLDFASDIAYSGESSTAKSRGIGDSYRHVFHSKLSAKELLGRLTPSLNLMFYKYDDNIFKLASFKSIFNYNTKGDTGRMFYKEPTVASFDIRGPITDKLNIFADLAFSVVDTNWFIGNGKILDEESGTATSNTELANTKTSMKPAFYGRVESKYGLPINLDFALISEGFYSPLSFAVPSDIFYPFGSNLVGPGKFIARGEASPYSQNMTGINLQFAPKLSGYGHLKFSYGQHMQLNEGQDVIYFPYRLNGQDLFSLFHSSYSRWGNYQVDLNMGGTYRNRLGDESFKTTGYDDAKYPDSPMGSGSGALRSDYLGMMESFVPYESATQADSNLAEKNTVYEKSKWVPRHRKFSFSADFDFAYDISSMIGYSNDLFISFYGALNSVSTTFLPCAFNAKNEDMLLFGSYLRMEPAIAFSKKFYLLGLVGFESWKSEKAYTRSKVEKNGKLVDGSAISSPIDYHDFAIGLGFDWDVLSRVGLHGRVKWMKHKDVDLPENNYEMPIISTEIKMWF